MAKVQLIDVSKVYKGNVRAVSDFNLDIKDGEFIIFVGPSGCGKSTTLRMVAGLEEITSGKIYIDDVMVNNLEPKDRDIAMVFQNYALYPHMSIFDNLAYSLRCHHAPKDEIDQKVNSVAKLLDIEELLNRKPKELSGGQRQRVALGRCIIRNPKVFLFDEPLSNLDAKLRVQMRSEISKLHKQVQGTFIYVTHDQTEAMTMGDRIVVMKDGFVQQIDTPVNLYEHPINIFVATFLGSPQMNIFKATLKDDYVILNEEYSLKLSDKIKNKLIDGYVGEEIYLGIRPGDFILGNEKDYDFCIDKVDLIEKLGHETLFYFTLPGKDNSAIASLRLDMSINIQGPIYLKVNLDKIHLFNKEEESILKINDFNYLPCSIEIKGNDALIDEKYQYPNFINKCVGLVSSNLFNGYLKMNCKDLTINRNEESDIAIKVKIVAKDVRSDKNVYFATDGKNRITFMLDKEMEYEVSQEIDLYISISQLDLCDEEKNILTVQDELPKPIMECDIKLIGKEYYVITPDKSFVKNKYFLIEKIYNLNNKMILLVKNSKGLYSSLLIEHNDDFFNGLILYIKYRK